VSGGATVTLVAVGTCTIQATQAGNANYAAATPVNQSFITSVLTVTTPGSLASGTVGVGYGPVTYAASGGTGQGYTWSCTGLPSGLTISTAGVLSGTPASGSQGSYTAVCMVRDSGGNTAQSSLALAINAQPVLSIVKSHTGNFTQGQTGATYSVVVSNSATASPTSGIVTVVDTLPAGLTPTAIAGGMSWSCTLATLTCTNNNVLAAGASYPTITVTVNVAINATSPLVNSATVSGGGATAVTATDSASLTFPPAALSTLNDAQFTGPSSSICLSTNGSPCGPATAPASATNGSVLYDANSTALLGQLGARASLLFSGSGATPTSVSAGAKSTFQDVLTIGNGTGTGTLNLTFENNGTISGATAGQPDCVNAGTGQSSPAQLQYVPFVAGQLDYSLAVVCPVGNGASTTTIPISFTFGAPLAFEVELDVIAEISPLVSGAEVEVDYNTQPSKLSAITVYDSQNAPVPLSIQSESGAVYTATGIALSGPTLNVAVFHAGNFIGICLPRETTA
jgi:hypothetical protein